MEEEKQKDWCEEFTQKVEQQIKEISAEGVNTNNVDYLYRLVDIHKDLKNEEYWKEKGEHMRYSRGGSYNERGRGSYNERGRGSYNEGYGARGRGRERDSRGRYKGHEMIDDMYMEYGNYAEGREQYSRGGSYGAKEDVVKSLEYMMESVVCFVEMLMEDAESQEEMEIIKQLIKRLLINLLIRTQKKDIV